MTITASERMAAYPKECVSGKAHRWNIGKQHMDGDSAPDPYGLAPNVGYCVHCEAVHVFPTWGEIWSDLETTMRTEDLAWLETLDLAERVAA